MHLFLLKFHCELNPIERCWCHAKKYTRAYCTIGLRKIVQEGIANIRFLSSCLFLLMRHHIKRSQMIP